MLTESDLAEIEQRMNSACTSVGCMPCVVCDSRINDIPTLLAEVRRLRAELERLRDVKNRIFRKWHECPSLNIGREPTDEGYADFEELEDLIVELFE